MQRTTLSILIACFVISACSTEGAYIKEEQFEALKAEVMSAEQLVEALGPPSVTYPRIDGNIMWVYEGVYTQQDPTRYVPYLDILVGTNSQICTRISVVVSSEDGSLSNWDYSNERDTDHWTNTDNRCSPRQIPSEE